MTVPIRGEVGEVLPCRQVNPDLFFAEAPSDVEAAKALCRDCPIQEALPEPFAPAAGTGGSEAAA